jgi:hypothetical protein
MDPTIAATVIGVLLTVAFGGLATMLAWLRSDTNDRFDRVDTRFDKVDVRFERLEAKVDGLILGLTRRGFLSDPEEPSTADD